MNRFAYDNIDPSLAPARRKQALEPKGINRFMSPRRRAAKQARNVENRRKRRFGDEA